MLTIYQNTLMVAAQSLLGSAPILMSTSGSLGSRFNVPAGSAAPSTLLVFKDHEATPAATLTLSGSTAQAAVTAWLHANKFPSALELVADVFQGVMSAPHAPLVVLSAVPPADAPGHAGAIAQVHEAAKQWARSPEATARPGQHVQFVWMDAVRWKSWLKGQYGLKGADLPETVLVRHKVLSSLSHEFGRQLMLL
jgi:thioredoxin domain-containing protein 5